MKLFKRISVIVLPCACMAALVYFMQGGKNILSGIYIIFPLMYIALGIISSSFLKELLISMILTTAAFLIPINLLFRMGTCIDLALIYVALGTSAYFIKYGIKKAIQKKRGKVKKSV